MTLRAAICGASGYTGAELLRILRGHPNVRVTALTSEKSAGKTPGDIYPHLNGLTELAYEPLNKERLAKKADVFFLALPHGASQEAVNYFFRAGKKVIDLSADFRLRDPLVYEQWYKTPHVFKWTLKRAVYGLPEIYRLKIKGASLVANPGCYPTGALLGLYPALKDGYIDASSIVIDSKSGVSGAGRKADLALSFCEVNGGFRAYGVGTHRHTPEIEQEISAIARKKLTVDFTPHLLPIDRGILTTIYAKLVKQTATAEVLAAYKTHYGKEPFVRVLREGAFPDLKAVKGSNFCDIGIKVNERTGRLVIVTAIDNLVKGAAGQAVQNMNVMVGLDEKTALNSPALFP